MAGFEFAEIPQEGNAPRRVLRWFLGGCALIAGGGLLADHVWWSGVSGPSIAERVGEALGAIFLYVLGVAAGVLMLFAIVSWVIEAGQWVAGLVRRTYRFLRDHTWREIIGTLAPVTFSLAASFGFAYVTAGENAGYWILVAIGSVFTAGGVAIAAAIVWPLLDLIGQGIGWLFALPWRLVSARLAGWVRTGVKLAVMWVPPVVAHGYIFVFVMPDVDLVGEATWGTYVTFLVGIGTVTAAARAGTLLKRRWVHVPEPEPVDTAEDEYWSPTAIPAWRAWGWTGEVLKGVWQPWTSSTFVAECLDCEEVPGARHTCGVYSFKEVSDVVAMTGRRPGLVIGRVELSGLVIEHERGYRAGEVRIVELMAPPSIAAEVQARYPDVPVRSRLLEGVIDG